MGFSLGGSVTGGLTGFAAGGPIGAAIGGLAGGFLGPDGTPQAPQVQFNPSNVRTGGGFTQFDKESNTFTSGLSPQLLAQQQQLFGTGAGFLNELNTFNPDEFGANVSDRLRNLAAPQEEQDRLGLENRLFKQGLLSSTLGSDRFESLLTAQSLAEEARVARGFSLGQDVQGNLLDRSLSAFSAGNQLEQLPLQFMEQSIAGGRGQSAADQFNASNVFESSKLQADTDSAFLSSLLGGVGAFADTDFGSSFNSFFGGGSSVADLAADPFLDAGAAGNQDFAF